MDIGLIWDKYDGRLKAQVLKDLLALSSDADLKRVCVKAPEGESIEWLTPLLQLVGVPNVETLKPVMWRAYTIKEEPMMPDCCEDWILKDLRIQKSRGVPLTLHTESYPSLIRQSDERVVPSGMTLTLNKMPYRPPTGNQVPTLPANFLYSPFI